VCERRKIRKPIMSRMQRAARNLALRVENQPAGLAGRSIINRLLWKSQALPPVRRAAATARRVMFRRVAETIFEDLREPGDGPNCRATDRLDLAGYIRRNPHRACRREGRHHGGFCSEKMVPKKSPATIMSHEWRQGGREVQALFSRGIETSQFCLASIRIV
jgi:hypothetical protein